MTPFSVFIILSLFLLIVLLFPLSFRDTTTKRKEAARANDLLNEAEGLLLRGEYDQAHSDFQEAYLLAATINSLLAAEALYGMARICLQQNQQEQAAKHLEEAIASQKTGWGKAKPEFAKLLSSQLEKIRQGQSQQ